MKRIFVLIILGFIANLMSKAHDFKENGIYYNIVNEETRMVAVTAKNAHKSYQWASYVPLLRLAVLPVYYIREQTSTKSYKGQVVIPEIVVHRNKTYTVVAIESKAFFDNDKVTSVTIPKYVTQIGDNAFDGCENLVEVNYNAENCSKVNDVFKNCKNLKLLNIGEGVKNIPNNAFQDCKGLTIISIPQSVTQIGDNAFGGCGNLTEVNFNAENCTIMGSSKKQVFSGCVNLKTLNIGNNVKEIPSYAFSNCASLKSVTLPASLIKIGESAFRNCSSLTSISIPNSVVSLGDYSFAECINLKDIIIGCSVKDINNKVFNGCNGIKTISYNVERGSRDSNTDIDVVKVDVEGISTAWVVVDDYVEMVVLDANMGADISSFPENTVLSGNVRNGSLYITDYFDNECYKVSTNGLQEVVISMDIPLKYGDGRIYKAGEGGVFKIEPFDIVGKRVLLPEHNSSGVCYVEYDKANDDFAQGLKKIINENRLYLLYTCATICTYNDDEQSEFKLYQTDWELFSLLEKTEYGFRSCGYCIWEDGKLDDEFVLGYVDYHDYDLIRWIPSLNGLVYDIYSERAEVHSVERACVLDVVSQSDYINYDVIGKVKDIDGKIKFTQDGRLITSKKDIVIRDKYGWLLWVKWYNEELSSMEYNECYDLECWRYDMRGNVIEHNFGSCCIDVGSAPICKYDNNGNIVEEIVDNSGTSVFVIDTITYKYMSFDERGNWTKRGCINSGIYEDDDIGKTTWHKFTYEETCERIYDEKGNWVKMTIKRRATDNNKDNYYNKEDNVISPKEETRTRTIKYYEDTYD